MTQQTNAYSEKIKKLAGYFQEQTADCRVMNEWKIDYRCHRFYFEKNGHWLYILDVSTGDLEEQDTSKLIELLEAFKWRQKLAESSGKRIPIFSDKRFSAQFHDWPRK